MADITLTGGDLLTLVKQRLLGYGNIADTATLMSFVNDGKDQVWMILKSLIADYFMVKSQYTDPSQDNYFGPVSQASRSYALPNDFREIRFVECLSSGFEDLIFECNEVTDENWRRLRRASTGDTNNTTQNVRYHYTITGQNTLDFAQAPETTLNLVLWYIRRIADLEIDDTVPDILFPYVKKIADFASKKLMLAAQDTAQFEEWSKQWREEVMMIAQSASPRNLSDPVYVETFEG